MEEAVGYDYPPSSVTRTDGKLLKKVLGEILLSAFLQNRCLLQGKGNHEILGNPN